MKSFGRNILKIFGVIFALGLVFIIIAFFQIQHYLESHTFVDYSMVVTRIDGESTETTKFSESEFKKENYIQGETYQIDLNIVSIYGS